MRPEKSGSDIIIKNPDGFNRWFDTDNEERERNERENNSDENEDGGLLSRILH